MVIKKSNVKRAQRPFGFLPVCSTDFRPPQKAKQKPKRKHEAEAKAEPSVALMNINDEQHHC
jgi:hypothetical protein